MSCVREKKRRPDEDRKELVKRLAYWGQKMEELEKRVLEGLQLDPREGNWVLLVEEGKEVHVVEDLSEISEMDLTIDTS